jgi:hypothetical protein
MQSQSKKEVTRWLKTSLLGVGGCFIVAEGNPVLSGQPPIGLGVSATQRPAEKRAAVPEGASGMIIHIDPQTGEFGRTPAPGTVPLQLSPQERNAFSTSHQGLVEIPSSVPGGGVKLDLQGRFHSPLAVTVDPDGKLKMQRTRVGGQESTPITANYRGASDEIGEELGVHFLAGVRPFVDSRLPVFRRAGRDLGRHQQ